MRPPMPSEPRLNTRIALHAERLKQLEADAKERDHELGQMMREVSEFRRETGEELAKLNAKLEPLAEKISEKPTLGAGSLGIALVIIQLLAEAVKALVMHH